MIRTRYAYVARRLWLGWPARPALELFLSGMRLDRLDIVMRGIGILENKAMLHTFNIRGAKLE